MVLPRTFNCLRTGVVSQKHIAKAIDRRAPTLFL
jgi:hypothetical protein